MKKARLKIQCLTFLTVAFLAIPLHGQSSADEGRDKIEAHYQTMKKAMENKDPAAISDLYAVDAILFPPQGGSAEGRPAILKAFSGMVQGGLVIDAKPVEVEKLADDVIYERGLGRIYNSEGTLMDEQPYVVIWKKENGSWKIWRDFVKGGMKK